MLIKKSTMNEHKVLSIANLNRTKFNIQYRQKTISSEKLIPSSLAMHLAASATSCNTHHNQCDDHHHHHHQQRSRGHCDPKQRTCLLRSYSWWCLSSIMAILGVSIVLPLAPHCEAVGYSYTRFRGPVSGPEHLIYLPHRGGNVAAEDETDDPAALMDYVAKPEYEFAYGVEDAQAHILHNRNEMRDGDAVKGVYSVVDPDGTLRVVKYTADDINGFQAEVIMNGISSIHGQLQPDTPTTISNLNINHYQHSNDDNQNPLNSYSSQQYNNIRYYPYQYVTSASSESPPTTVDYHNFKDHYNNGDDYQPQYEVHEKPNDNVDYQDDNNNTNENDQNKVPKNNGDGKKKDYDDDDNDKDDDEEVDDYEDSDEVEDYDEAVNKNKNNFSNESDEYY